MEEFDINQLILNTLKPLNIPVYFVSRKEVKFPMIVFNVTGERSYQFWEDEEQMIKYRVSVNLFSKGNFIKYKNEIAKLMKMAGFKRTDIPECIYHEDVEVYNQPLFFEYILEN